MTEQFSPNDDEVLVAIEGRDRSALDGIIEAFSECHQGTVIYAQNASNSTAAGIPWHEFSVIGRDVALVVIPIIAYLIGKGKKVKIKTRDRTIELSGFSKKDVKELYKLLSKK